MKGVKEGKLAMEWITLSIGDMHVGPQAHCLLPRVVGLLNQQCVGTRACSSRLHKIRRERIILPIIVYLISEWEGQASVILNWKDKNNLPYNYLSLKVK